MRTVEENLPLVFINERDKGVHIFNFRSWLNMRSEGINTVTCIAMHRHDKH
jgi:hypothetical protein